VAATDKIGEEYHVIKFIKYTDLESNSRSLEDITDEEIKSFNKEEFGKYMTQFDKPKSRYSSIAKASSVSAALNQTMTEILSNGSGILGFIKFLKGYYLLMITQKKKVAKIGLHNIYKIQDMKMVPLFRNVTKNKQEDENKYVQLFLQIKIHEGFFFSYTYDLTHTLQNNIVNKIKKKDKKIDEDEYAREEAEESSDSEEEAQKGDGTSLLNLPVETNTNFLRQSVRVDLSSHGIQEKWLKEHSPFESMFLWNHYLIKDFYKILVKKKWVMPIIYGDIGTCNFKTDT